MWDTVQQIAIYIHRFHNLDLFQQGFYQIKVSMRWENNNYTSLAIPSRVVQYEANGLGSGNIDGAWRINNTENSFFTPPFRVKYMRQDICLSLMVSFNLSLSKYEVPSTSAVILKFELMQAPVIADRLELLAYLDASSVAVHEFRIPPKALLGLHAYCPIHFDIFHAVLVEASVHVILLKDAPHMQISSAPCHIEDVAGESVDRSNQALGPAILVGMDRIMLVKSLLVARDTLLEELQSLSKAVDKVIDLTDFMSKMNNMNMLNSILRADLDNAYGEVREQGDLQDGLKIENGNPDLQSDSLPYFLPKDAVVNIFQLLGAQLSYLWRTFLQFHRVNNTKILEFLSDAWAKDRRNEWSIWMVYSKPVQTAATRAELHRRNIAQMRINTRSIQDMYIFGDPLRIPIIFVERVINASRRTFSENSYFKILDLIDSSVFVAGPHTKALKNHPGGSAQKRAHELKIVVFVHGFQAMLYVSNNFSIHVVRDLNVGHHQDLRLIRNQWLLIEPKTEVLMSDVNEDKTSGDFRDMGLRLAEEVVSFVNRKLNKFSTSPSPRDVKLSFVGHSIGNVIIRSALAESIMEPFRRHLYTYVSISGPQLGYLYSSNSLFNSGMWFMKKFKGTHCIRQLTFTDDSNLQNTFFYKLCEQRTLENFRHIILISSPQDGYVPYHSARIELCRAAALDYLGKGRIFLQMLNNCLDQIRAPTSQQRVYIRCDVNFDTSSYGKNFNTLIGRTAHIEFLESDIFA
ncbi:hypothetical protein MANES_05G186300v8, partial [Manihot esculenta]